MNVSILIIGSLLWDEAVHRSDWRRERLDLEKGRSVRVPIRYGRCSGGRCDTYTMVFSELVRRADYGMGTGLMVRCKRSVSSLADLIEEVDELWKAESLKGNPPTRLHASWGGVGILFRDTGSPLQDEWTDWVRNRGSYPVLRSCESEAPTLNPEGVLRLQWPVDDHGDIVDDTDILLGTANNPTLRDGRYPRYARSSEIARAWVADDCGNEEYFFNNVEAGIRTFQDRRIWQFLSRSKKLPEYREAYPDAIDLLESGNAPSA